MEFSINRQAFLERLTAAAGPVSAVSPVQQLSGLLLELFDDRLQITGSGNDLTIQTSIYPGELTGLQIEDTGSVILEAGRLIDLVRKLDEDFVTLETSESGQCWLKDNMGVYTLLGRPGSDYPNIALDRPDDHLVLSGKQIKEICDEVSYACSQKDNDKVVLKGVNFRTEGNNLVCTATDSYRLSSKVVELKEPADIKMVLPKKSLIEITKNISDSEDQDIDIYINPKKAQFITDKTLIQTQLYEGIFPNTSRVVPQSGSSLLTISPTRLYRAMDLASLYRSDKPLCQISCDGNLLKVKAKNDTIGTSDNELVDFKFEGEPFDIIMNADYLKQALQPLRHANNVELLLGGPNSPIKITNPEDDSLVMVLVPVRSNYNY